MCGIAGLIPKNADGSAGRLIQAMTDAVAHRGPDGDGTWNGPQVSLGHRRLSIIDLSDFGKQPMIDDASGSVITYNGEIYNYLELRRELAELGHRFTSNSDTEVILKAYAQWGTACVSHFNGMWAFAIYDPAKSVVFCSRDRFGVKPFYYAETGAGFAFGSEIRQILPLIDRKVADRRILMDFLVARVAEDTEASFFSGVRKLPGGHNLIYDLSRGRFEIQRYYDLAANAAYRGYGMQEALEAFDTLFQDAIRLRLRSDVKVGTCLSGGMDSSSIASLAAAIYGRESKKAFSAITAISEDPATDESAFARMIVETAGLEWLTVKPGYEDFRAVLDSVVRAQEEPFAGTSVFMQYFVMREARKAGIPVLLDGQGGDETLLGYERYFADYLMRTLRGRDFVDAFRFIGSLMRNGRAGALKALLWNLAYFHTPLARKVAWKSSATIFREEYAGHLRADEPVRGNDDNLFSLRKLEIERVSLPALLRYEDKNSMAHAVETRLPFLDYRLVELATSLSAEIKLHDGWNKYLLRKSMDGRLPSEIVWRKHKFGFEAPESRWMNRHGAEIEKTIRASGLLSSIIREPLAANDGLRSLNQGLKWRLYSVALWEREFGVE